MPTASPAVQRPWALPPVIARPHMRPHDDNVHFSKPPTAFDPPVLAGILWHHNLRVKSDQIHPAFS